MLSFHRFYTISNINHQIRCNTQNYLRIIYQLSQCQSSQLFFGFYCSQDKAYLSSNRKFFWATAQTLICQMPFFLPTLVNRTTEWRLSYILGILILSAVSSLKPIMQVLLENPLNGFTQAIKGISEPTPEQIPFRYTEIQTDEELAELREEDIKTPIWSKIKKILKFTTQLFKVIYSTIQLVLALILIFGFICVFIQVANPESQLLSQLNAINALQQFDNQSQTEEWVSIVVISIFKYVFVIIMYFQSNLCIDYNKKTGLVALINNIIVIIRKNLLYFTLIGLLTTLYPNLTFTINNSECFKDIHYHNNQYMIKQQRYDQSDNCPITLVYLETIRLFQSNVSVVIGLAVLSMYLMHACYLVIIKVMQPARVI